MILDADGFGPDQLTALFTSRSDISHEIPSPEQIDDLAAFRALLVEWSGRMNLVGPKELDRFWHRHVADSWQLVPLIPADATFVLDLGAGAGFPGLVLGIALKHRPQADVMLVESIGKKCLFLEAVAKELRLPVHVTRDRIEELTPRAVGVPDIITARALAPLPKLLSLANPFMGKQSTALFLKGGSADAEIDAVPDRSRYKFRSVPSVLDGGGAVVCVRRAA